MSGSEGLTFFCQTPPVNGFQQCLGRRILGKQPYIYIHIYTHIYIHVHTYAYMACANDRQRVRECISSFSSKRGKAEDGKASGFILYYARADATRTPRTKGGEPSMVRPAQPRSENDGTNLVTAQGPCKCLPPPSPASASSLRLSQWR